jgi:hypothetical protein
MGNWDFSGRSTAFNWTQGSTDPVIYGSVTLSASMTMTTVTGTPTWTFSGAGLTQTVDTAGITLRLSNFIIDSPSGTVSLARDTVLALSGTTTGTATLTQGTLALNTYTFTMVQFSSTNTNTRTLAFGTGNIALTGNAATIWTTATVTGLTVSGTPVVNASYSGATGTRTITFGALSEANSISLNVSAGTDIVALTATGGFKNLVFTGFAGTLTNTARTIYGNLTLVSGMTLTAGANATTFAATSNTKTITTATKTIDFPLTFSGLGGTFAFQDALTQGATRAFTITNGTVQLRASATSTVGSFVTSGSTLKYLQSTTPGTQATISQASGTVTATYLSVKDSAATGGATWNALAATNVDAGNNTGWSLPIPIIVVIGSGITIGGGIGFGIV